MDLDVPPCVGSMVTRDWQEVIKLPQMTHETLLHSGVTIKADQRSFRTTIIRTMSHILNTVFLQCNHFSDALFQPPSGPWPVCYYYINGHTTERSGPGHHFDFNSCFLTCGLCRSSSCCFSRSRSFSICWSLIWLLPAMTPLWVLGASCPPCFTGALWVILCWFMAVRQKTVQFSHYCHYNMSF